MATGTLPGRSDLPRLTPTAWSSAFRRKLVVCTSAIVFTSSLGLIGAAQAQVAAPSVGGAGTLGAGSTIAGQPASQELGIPLGSFRLYPTLETRGGYDSNPFAQSAGQQGGGSSYFDIRPSLELNSDWNNHALNFQAIGDFGFYPNASSQNYQNFLFGSNGRLDIQRDFNLSGKVAFSRQTQALGSPDTSLFTQPSVVNSLPAEVALYQRFNRFFYRAAARITPLWYTQYGFVPSNVLPSASQDRTEFGEELRTGYEIYDGLDVWVQGGLAQRRYTQAINVLNQARDANDWSVVGGATWDLGGVTKLEGFAGYSEESYPSQFPKVSAPTFGLAGIWNGYQPLIVRPFINRSFQGTAFTNYTGYILTNFGIAFDYTVHSDWQLTGGASYGLAEYQVIQGIGATARTDNFYRAGVGLLYSIRPEVMIGPSYEFQAANGNNIDSPNYNRSIVYLRLVLRR